MSYYIVSLLQQEEHIQSALWELSGNELGTSAFWSPSRVCHSKWKSSEVHNSHNTHIWTMTMCEKWTMTLCQWRKSDHHHLCVPCVQMTLLCDRWVFVLLLIPCSLFLSFFSTFACLFLQVTIWLRTLSCSSSCSLSYTFPWICFPTSQSSTTSFDCFCWFQVYCPGYKGATRRVSLSVALFRHVNVTVSESEFLFSLNMVFLRYSGVSARSHALGTYLLFDTTWQARALSTGMLI